MPFVIGSTLLAILGIAVAIALFISPLMLYGIYFRLGRLVELQQDDIRSGRAAGRSSLTGFSLR